jgi:hypothetical protein
MQESDDGLTSFMTSSSMNGSLEAMDCVDKVDVEDHIF